MNRITKALAISVILLVLTAGLGSASAQSSPPVLALRVRITRGPPQLPVQPPAQSPEPQPESAPEVSPEPSPSPQAGNVSPSPRSSPLAILLSVFDVIGKETFRGIVWIAKYLHLPISDSAIGRLFSSGGGGSGVQEQFIWDHDPLTVSIRVDSSSESVAVDLVKAAITDWQDRIRTRIGVTNIPTSTTLFGIKFVSSSSSADISITLKNKVDPALGYTNVVTTYGRVERVEIILPTKTGAGFPLEKADIQNVAAHEFGHALGLGHSTAFGDVMYAQYDVLGTGGLIHPSACDVDRLLGMYLKDGFAPPNSRTSLGEFSCN